MMIWGVHFGGSYGVASIAAELGDASAPLARTAVIVWTLACLAADALLIRFAIRAAQAAPDGDVGGWVAQLGAALAALSLVGVAWQGIVPLLGA